MNKLIAALLPLCLLVGTANAQQAAAPSTSVTMPTIDCKIVYSHNGSFISMPNEVCARGQTQVAIQAHAAGSGDDGDAGGVPPAAAAFQSGANAAALANIRERTAMAEAAARSWTPPNQLAVDAGSISGNLSLSDPFNTECAAHEAALQVAVLKVQSAAQATLAAEPDEEAQEWAAKLQSRAADDAKSTTDGEILQGALLSHVPGGSPDNSGPIFGSPVNGLYETLSHALELGTAFLEASTPSNTAGLTLDEGPALNPDQQQHVTAQYTAYAAAQRLLQQAQQELSELIAQKPECSLKTPEQIEQDSQPQIQAQ
jgi:hypothetical protein